MASYGPDLKLAGTIPRSATATGSFVVDVDDLSPDRKRFADASGFEAKPGQTLSIPNEDGPIEVLVGLGSGGESDASVDDYRRAAAAFARAVSRQSTVALVMGDGISADAVTAAVEGAGLASYRYVAQKGKGTTPKSGTTRITVVAKGKGIAAAFALGQRMVSGVAITRDLVNEPGGSLLPTEFVKSARSAVKGAGPLKVTVWDKPRILKEKLGGIEFVNKGSTHPPRLLQITYTPASKSKAKQIALVGKGITFDSGGLSLKTGTGMMTMKVDMAGGAAVVGAMTMLSELGCKNGVTAYIPLTDNMPSGDAGRPGDVFTARNGKTVEVLNTDAEGRLVLADALALAAEKKPDAIVDIATLTGSVTGALGPKFTGLMGNDDAVVEAVRAASEASGENVWHLPLPTEYRKDLDSDIADLRNIGKGPYGGALVAGLFLKEFVDGVPWAHLDLGLAALADGDDGVFVKGATGAGARALARFATDF